jgi:MATE family multidrug resistance protein
MVGQLVNVGCNYVLIFGKFGFPQMGIRGAAWGTFIGIVVGAGIRMWVFMGSGINEKFHSRSSLRPDMGKMKDLLKVGLPAGFGLMVNVSLWAMILLGLVGRFGKEAVAATSAVFSYINISVMPIVGIGTALTAAVGKSIGAGRNDIAKKQTSICLRIGLTYMGFVGLCFFVFRDNLMAMWSTDSKVIDTGVKILICAAIFQVFDAATIIYNGSLRGAGDTVWIAAMSAIGAIVILGGGGWVILNYFEELGIIGPWIAATVNIIAVGIANRWRFKSGRWMEIDLFKRRATGVAVEIEALID